MVFFSLIKSLNDASMLYVSKIYFEIKSFLLFLANRMAY